MADALVITTDSLEPGDVGLSYDNEGANMEASGGLGTNTWTLSTGPSWLSLSETGVFSSTDDETIVGEYPVTIGVTDESNRGNGQLVERDYTLNIVICSGEDECWEGRNNACAVGIRACVNGEFGACVIDEDNVNYSVELAHCGPDCNPCDTAIANICSAGICGCGGGAACTGDLNCCGEKALGSCVNLLTDPAHCDKCGFDCAVRVLHVETPATCVGGVCGYEGDCADGWHDCDGDRSNGCEVEQGVANCGFCEDNCVTGPNAEPGTCNEETDRCDYVCEGHFADCDSAAPGCETDLTLAATCGDCPGGNVTDCTLGEVDLLCLYDSVNTEYYCGCDVGANHQGNNQDNPDGNVLCGDAQICCVVDGKGTCVEHDAEHCFDCGVVTESVCNPSVGGIYCVPA
ncbi:MAG: putative Ig domain-containing protein, partial [Lentisphaeria bacterium]|nr:putative Ig domain-containing protein [Lentisphaeria bacterium]